MGSLGLWGSDKMAAAGLVRGRLLFLGDFFVGGKPVWALFCADLQNFN